MSKPTHKRRKLSSIINLTLLVLYLLGSVVLVTVININTKQQALHNAERYSRLILDRNVLTHSFFNNVLKTSLFELLEEHFFDPSWMTATFAIRSVANDYEFFGVEGLYYKEASINARNPANEADPYEVAFLKRLVHEPGTDFHSEIRDYDGAPFYVVMRRGQTVQAECLRCHGSPEDAPNGIVTHYGNERGFNRQLGTTVSTISIRIPLAMAYQAANRFSLTLSGWLLIVLLVIFAIHYTVSRHVLFKPINKLSRKARTVANNPESLGEPLQTPVGQELAEMVDAFNQMSANLKHHQDSLEETIRTRTDQLERANRALLEDIEKRKQVERKLDRLHQRNEMILNTAREGIMGLDPQGRITFLNRAAETLLGCREEDLALKQLSDLLNSSTDAEQPNPWDLIEQTLVKGTTINQDEAVMIHRSGRTFPIEFSCAPITENGIVGAVFSFNDITDRKLSEEEIQKLAFYDQLTGLSNRTLFYDRITQRVAQAGRDHHRLALMFLDLDDFKRVNDTMGHAAGDEFLKTIGQRLLQGSRQTDTVARLGGDEFVWFGEVSSEENARMIARKFLESIAKPVSLEGNELASTVSIGIALYPDSASDVVGLLKCADTAMYEAKQKSKNAFQVYRKKATA